LLLLIRKPPSPLPRHPPDHRHYVIVRRDFATQTLLDRAALDLETQRTKALQRELWQETVAVTQHNQNMVVVTYFTVAERHD
jgi:hypothetical protein